MKKRAFEYSYNTNQGGFISFTKSDLKRQLTKDSSVSVIVYPTNKEYKTKRNSDERTVYLVTSKSIIDNDCYLLTYKKHIEEPKEFSTLEEVLLYLNNLGLTNDKIRILGFGKGSIYFEEAQN